MGPASPAFGGSQLSGNHVTYMWSLDFTPIVGEAQVQQAKSGPIAGWRYDNREQTKD
jgi:hypothetical protein